MNYYYNIIWYYFNIVRNIIIILYKSIQLYAIILYYFVININNKNSHPNKPEYTYYSFFYNIFKSCFY